MRPPPLHVQAIHAIRKVLYSPLVPLYGAGLPLPHLKRIGGLVVALDAPLRHYLARRWINNSFLPGRQIAGCLPAKAGKGRSPGGPGGCNPHAEERPRRGPEASRHPLVGLFPSLRGLLAAGTGGARPRRAHRDRALAPISLIQELKVGKPSIHAGSQGGVDAQR